MTKKSVLFIFAILPCLAFAQKVWTKVDESQISLRSNEYRDIIPERYTAFEFDNQSFQSLLTDAPNEAIMSAKGSTVTIDLPMPDGTTGSFVVWNAPVMQPALAAKYPGILSFKGYLASDRSVVARFGIGANGFHASILDHDGMVYVDPYSVGNTKNYISYYTKDHNDTSISDRPMCGSVDEAAHHLGISSDELESRSIGDKIELRTYRLALACTGEWGVKRGSVEAALAEMVTFIERANIVFETEVALRVILIDRNDELIFLDGVNDPFDNPSQGLDLVGKNTNILNGRIGSASYDIGHLFSVCFDVGGVAAGQICTSGGRGAGVTCHNGNSVSTGIVLVFNHEVGHQMTASHTFNRCGNTDQLALGTAFEPGSGSTIMAYPGACGSDNLGIPREAYYHGATLEQMLSFTNTETSDAYACATKVDINNHLPVISLDYTNGFYIPKSTPFFLKGSAEDIDGDNLTYTWEQFDNMSSNPLGQPVGNCPLFRSLKASVNPIRYFPNINDLFAGRFTNNTELMPTYGRGMTFRFITRDNNPLGNGAVWQDIKFNVAADAGPFKLTYPVLDYKFKVGQEIDVTWDVANTDIAPINCKNVDIYISFSGSLDFDSDNMVLVAASTPNDGSETIIIPNRLSTKVRVVVKASDNIFLTTGLFNSYIEEPETPNFFTDVDNSILELCLPEAANFTFNSAGFAGFEDKIYFEVVSGLPQGAVASFSKTDILPGETTTLNIDLLATMGTADYNVVVRSYAEGIDTIERTLQLKITGTDLSNIALMSPENGLNGVGPTQTYMWSPKIDAIMYHLEVATSPDFAPENTVISRQTTALFINSNTFLDKATIYYWRVRSSNDCRFGEWSEIYAFNTEALTCSVTSSGNLSVNISGSGMPTVEASVNVFVDGEISDVNLKNVRGDHAWVGDLAAYLVAPSGKEVLLWNRKCGSSKGFNIGLDDQSNQFFQCPINTGVIYRPESPLSAFNGESMKGAWTLRLEDRASGNGGKLTNFDLELCANIVLSPPLLTRNQTLQIHPKDKKEIDRTLLLVEDPNNVASELTYTLVESPFNGVLTLNDTPLLAGANFTQAQIDEFKLRYIHTADNEEEDHFRFNVSDGEGGWVSITQFTIEVDSAFPSSTKDDIFDNQILVYPNPTNEVLHIQTLSDMLYTKIELLDMAGRTIYSTAIDQEETSIDTQRLPSGMYLVKISNDIRAMYKKVVKR